MCLHWCRRLGMVFLTSILLLAGACNSSLDRTTGLQIANFAAANESEALSTPSPTIETPIQFLVPCKTILQGELKFLLARIAGSGASAAVHFSLQDSEPLFKAFPVPCSANMWAVFIAASYEHKPGYYTLYGTVEAQGVRTRYVCNGIEVVSRTFKQETIALDDSNTALRTEGSAKKDQERLQMTAILSSFDSEASLAFEPVKFPLDDIRLTSWYGDARLYKYSNGTAARTWHAGIDYGAKTGTPVRAGVHGKVILATDRSITGNTIVIEFGPGLYALYYHLSSLSCTAGDLVGPDSVIGKVGASGLATGAHLHFEVRNQGVPIDPELLFGKPLVDIHPALRVLYSTR